MKADENRKWTPAVVHGAVVAMIFVTAMATGPDPARGGAGDGVTEVEVGCNERGVRCRALAGGIALPGGLRGQFLLSFEDATLLDADSFDVSARVVNPRDPQLRSRLPRDTFIPSDFPVLLRIEPTQGGRLSFRRNWTLEVVTPNLEFTSHTPYRLFRAPNGGAFEDISLGLGSGSFRVLGSGAAFSELVIAADLRPVERVVGGKLARLQARLAAVQDEIGSAFDELDGALDEALAALQAGAVVQAIGSLDAFLAAVESASGDEIPDDTIPGDGVVGIAADLLSAARTLRHSLVLGLQSAQGGMSGFSKRLDVGPHSVDLRFEFEDAFVVDVDDLEIAGEIVDVNDPALRARLPEGVAVPEEFPVLIRVNPEAGREQAFGGVFDVEMRTDSLDFLGGTPLRLFKAPDGGAFEDVTRTFGLGSFRIGASGASFSEFLIAEDRRPIETVVATKFQSAGDVIDASAGDVPAAVRQQLKAALAEVQEDVEQGRLGEAFAGIASLVATIEEAAGDTLPSLWRSGEALVNVAGELLSLLETLKFSLELQEAPTAGSPGDVNQDGKVDVGDVFFLIDQVFGDAPQPAGILFPPETDEQR